MLICKVIKTLEQFQFEETIDKIHPKAEKGHR
jgi:hypothetical protein